MALDVINGADGLPFGGNETKISFNGFDTKVYYGVLPVYGASKIDWDDDALAYINTASISNLTEQFAVNTLTNDLKEYGLWDYLGSVWPLLGTTADQQKYNLKDPRDLDATGRLTFGSGITHSASGSTGDGTTNSYIRTHKITNGSFTYGVYIVNNIAENKTDIGLRPGAADGSSGTEIRLRSRNGSNQTYYALGNAYVTPNSDSRGLWVLQTIDYEYLPNTADIGVYKNGTLLASGSGSPRQFLPSNNVVLTYGAYNLIDTTYEEGSTKTYGLAFEYSEEWNQTQNTNMNEVVQNYIRLLGR